MHQKIKAWALYFGNLAFSGGFSIMSAMILELDSLVVDTER